MYLLDELHKWDHSTRKLQPQLESEFSKFYKRAKSEKQKNKKQTNNQGYNFAPNYIYETNDIMLP